MVFNKWNEDEALTLANFDQILDSKTLERGFNYWLSQSIANLEKIQENIWEASIWGDMHLKIHIKFEGQNIDAWHVEPNYEWNIVTIT